MDCLLVSMKVLTKEQQMVVEMECLMVPMLENQTVLMKDIELEYQREH